MQREHIKKADECWLRVALSSGLPANEVIQRAKDCNIGIGRLRRVAKRIGVVHEKDGAHGGWIWRLPKETGHETGTTF